jgi:hypothetical protein
MLTWLCALRAKLSKFFFGFVCSFMLDSSTNTEAPRLPPDPSDTGTGSVLQDNSNASRLELPHPGRRGRMSTPATAPLVGCLHIRSATLLSARAACSRIRRSHIGARLSGPEQVGHKCARTPARICTCVLAHTYAGRSRALRVTPADPSTQVRVHGIGHA